MEFMISRIEWNSAIPQFFSHVPFAASWTMDANWRHQSLNELISFLSFSPIGLVGLIYMKYAPKAVILIQSVITNFHEVKSEFTYLTAKVDTW